MADIFCPCYRNEQRQLVPQPSPDIFENGTKNSLKIQHLFSFYQALNWQEKNMPVSGITPLTPFHTLFIGTFWGPPRAGHPASSMYNTEIYFRRNFNHLTRYISNLWKPFTLLKACIKKKKKTNPQSLIIFFKNRLVKITLPRPENISGL